MEILPSLRLHHYYRSSCSWRVRWGFELKKIRAELSHVHLLKGETESPEHLERNPLGYVPVLEFLDEPLTSSGRYLPDSMAILQWAEEVAPDLWPLYPVGTGQKAIRARARVRQLAEVIHSGTQPISNINVQEYYAPDDAEARKRWAIHWMEHGLESLEFWLKKTAGRLSFGNDLTMADILLAPQAYNSARFGADLKKFPTVLRIYEELLMLPECKASHPDRFDPDVSTAK
jgi:maleylpyruvate isomerase